DYYCHVCDASANVLF
nr:immunoglobulin light chain junction region [Macaca mulatta]